MFRLNGAYIYSLAANLRPLSTINADMPKLSVYSILLPAIDHLEPFINGNPLGLHGCIPVGRDLLSTLQRAKADIPLETASFDLQIGAAVAYEIESKWRAFEITLNADLAIANLYITTRKGAYDTLTMAEDGLSAFPSGIESKVPDAVSDSKQAARCLAFDLPTAAAFHMHRAHEAVIQAYCRAIVLDEKKIPADKRSQEHWIKAIESVPGTEKVVSALRDIKDLHRNPVLHPQDSLNDSEEAIALLGAIYTSMTHMLKAIK